MTDPLKPLRAARCNDTDCDPAIDAEAMDQEAMRRYLLTRDEQALSIKQGAVPAWFTIDRLPSAYLLEVLDALAPTIRQVLAFRAACHRIEPPGEEPLVAYTEASAPSGARYICKRMDRGIDQAPDSWVQEVSDRYSSETVREMGQVALDLARLPKATRRGFRWWGGAGA